MSRILGRPLTIRRRPEADAMPSISTSLQPEQRMHFPTQGQTVASLERQGIYRGGLEHAIIQQRGFQTNSPAAIDYFKAGIASTTLPYAEVTVGPNTTGIELARAMYGQLTGKYLEEVPDRPDLAIAAFQDAYVSYAETNNFDPKFALIVRYRAGKEGEKSEAVKEFSKFVRFTWQNEGTHVGVFADDLSTTPTEMGIGLEAMRIQPRKPEQRLPQGNFKEVLVRNLEVYGRKTQITMNVGDITQAQGYDAIVRPAGNFFKDSADIASHSGNVERAILNAGGGEVYDAAQFYAQQQGDVFSFGQKAGDTIVTSAGDMQPDIAHVIHAQVHQMEPVYTITPKALENAVIATLERADKEGITSILFPVIGGGVSKGLDNVIKDNESAVLTLNTIQSYLHTHRDSKLTKIGIVKYPERGETLEAAAISARDYLTGANRQLEVVMQSAPETREQELGRPDIPIVFVEGQWVSTNEALTRLSATKYTMKFVRLEATLPDGAKRQVLAAERSSVYHEFIQKSTSSNVRRLAGFGDAKVHSEPEDAGEVRINVDGSGKVTIRVDKYSATYTKTWDLSKPAAAAEREVSLQAFGQMALKAAHPEFTGSLEDAVAQGLIELQAPELERAVSRRGVHQAPDTEAA